MAKRGVASKIALTALLVGLVPYASFAGETVIYTYDALGRLKVVNTTGTINNGQVYSWCYDDAGNRTVAKTSASGVAANCTPPSPPSISVNDSGAIEGNSVVFTVSLSAAYSSSVSVNYATAYGSAGSNDFIASANTLTFSAGQTSKTVSVMTFTDSLAELPETFTLNLSNPTGGATIADGQGVGTIEDDPEGGCSGEPQVCW